MRLQDLGAFLAPRTGDNNELIIWGIVAVFAVVAIVAVSVILIRSRKK
jgi:hypothetical protein